MQILRTQFEIRYTTILDFSSLYKTILSPYLKLATFKIENFSIPEEYCVLMFKDDQSVIDVRWDRIIFRPSSQTSLYDKKGPAAPYFEILKKLMALQSFGEVINVLLAIWVLKENISKEQYLSNYVKKSTVINNFQLDDIAIIQEFKGPGEEQIRVEHGFFKPEKDLAKFSIDDTTGVLKNKNGQLIQVTIVSKKIEPTIEDFRILNDRAGHLYVKEFEK